MYTTVLATCVTMAYTLNRLARTKVLLPCFIGGTFWRADGRSFLCDAQSRFELFAPSKLLEQAIGGDQVVLRVTRLRAEGFDCDHLQIVVKSQRELAPKNSARAVQFQNFVRAVRDHFLSEGLNEILTPHLVECPGLEPSLEPFAVELQNGRAVKPVFLPTSPEIHLKKAMAHGFTDIFEIKTCFRNKEWSPHHESEFLMLEWYRGFADLEMILEDLQTLVRRLDQLGFVKEARPFRFLTWADLFEERFGFKLTPSTTAEDLRELCTRVNVHFVLDESFNDLFHRILVDKLEPQLAGLGPVLVRDFPPSQAALAKLNAKGWADRFELYWNGLEIANAFNEVNDPKEQRERWAAELRERAHLGTTPLPPDEGLIEALEAGLPPAGGIALGLERLFMACQGLSDIAELRLFSSRRFF